MSEPTRFRRHGLRLAGVFAIVAAAFGPGAGAAHAQVLYGSVVGAVKDAQGATIPGATVTATNAATGLTRDTVTGEDGGYNLLNVLPGSYDVKVSLQGFKEFIKTGVPVTAGTVSRVEVTLEVGTLTETVTVASAVQLLQTDKADVHTEIKAKEIVTLPLNQYRNYQGLLNLVPGATPAAFQNDQTDTPGRALSTSVNGTNRNNNNTRLDGASSVNVWLPHHVGYVAPAETIDTVNISTNNFDAGQGMAGGAAITLVTKSGTNEFKGSAFYFRNQDELNARQFFDPTKLDSSISIGGGTIGGPVRKNRLFFFGSFEGNYERTSRFDIYTVPTARMRAGDFSEVNGIFPNFRLYDPATGNADGTGRQQFANNVIPANRISEIAKRIQALYPEPNNPGTNNGLQNNLFLARFPTADRDNYDAKVNWNRSAAHQIWGKFSTMQAEVANVYQLGFDGGGVGDTKTYLYTIGHTWTLSPTLLIDGNFGTNWMDQTVQASDFGTNYGTDIFGIPGTNGSDPRQSGMPAFTTGLGNADGRIGNVGNWHPLERHERSYTFTQNLTKLAGRHEMRAGFDFIRYQLDHWQPEIGAGPRGRLDFSGNTTGTPGYVANSWNTYASFLLGLNTGYDKSLQFEEMSGRENQFAFYVNDRWTVNDKLTLTAGLRYEYYPLMTRADRGIEALDLSTFQVLLGGVGSVPEDLGIKVSKNLWAPRVGAAYRLNAQTVLRGGFGITYNPLPWSRPLRGFYPATINLSAAANTYQYFQLANGIPPITTPDISSGSVLLPRGVQMRYPDADNVERGRTQQWNVAVERELLADIAVSLAYVGTKTDGGYADVNLNYAEAGGNNNRIYFAQAGTAQILEWGAITRSRYHSLQLAVNRPFKNGLLLKGAYTWSKAMNETDDDGWATMTWSQPSQMERNYAKAGFDRTHIFQMGFVYELPFAKQAEGVVGAVAKDWSINGIVSAFSGTPFTIGGDNTALNQQGGQQTIMQIGDIARVGDPGPDAVYYDPAAFAQPGGVWGNTGRNFLRGPSVWNVDLAAFKGFQFGTRYRLEFRAQATNVLNHTRWANPVTGFTDPNFLRIRTIYGESRRLQLGLRFQF